MNRRVLTVAIAATLLGGCAGPRPHAHFGVKAVPINVAFGKPKADDPRAPNGPFSLVPVPSGAGVIAVITNVQNVVEGGDDPLLNRGNKPALACPDADPFAFPTKEAGAQVDAPAPAGVYQYRVSGTASVNDKKRSFTDDVPVTVDNAGGDANASTFRTTMTLLGVTTKLTYKITAADANGVPGEVALAGIEASTPTGPRPSFVPAKPVRLLQLKATPSATWKDAGTDPLSQSTMTVDAQTISRDTVNACGVQVSAWKVQITQLMVTPNERVSSSRTLWIATEFGGLIVQDQTSYSGTTGSDHIEGDSTMTIDVDPAAKRAAR